LTASPQTVVIDPDDMVIPEFAAKLRDPTFIPGGASLRIGETSFGVPPQKVVVGDKELDKRFLWAPSRAATAPNRCNCFVVRVFFTFGACLRQQGFVIRLLRPD
jgi:hypothetical protein